MDSIIEDYGGGGCFQWWVVVALDYCMSDVAWNMMMMAFAGSVPDWWCLPPDGTFYNNSSGDGGGGGGGGGVDAGGDWWRSRNNLTFQACDAPHENTTTCDGYHVFDDSISTVVNEWDLVCDKKWIKPLMTSMQMVGVLFGALSGGQLSDTFGRRPTVYITALCHVILSLVAAFSVSWEMFIAMRVLIGITLGVELVATFSYPLEFVTPKYRQVVASLPGWHVGVFLFAFMAWLVPDWKYLHIGCAICGLTFLPTWFFVPESPRWLATKGRLKEAEAVVIRIAKFNGRPIPENLAGRLKKVAESEREAKKGHQYTYLDVYRGKWRAFISLLLHFIWFSLSFSYYGISFGVSALSGNLYLNIFLMSLIEVPGNLSTICLANSKLGRRWTCFLFFALCALSSFGVLVVSLTVTGDDQGTVTTALAMVSKLSVGCAWLTILTFTSEQYPTVIRNLGYGASNTVSRIGGALAPLLINMDTADEVVRGYVVIGVLMTVSGFLSFVPRETMGKGLKDTLKANPKKQASGKANGIGHDVSEVKGEPISSLSASVEMADGELWGDKKEFNMRL